MSKTPKYSNAGKGDKPRQEISPTEWADRWDKIYGKKKEPDEESAMKTALDIIKNLVKKYSNDMTLGGHVRHFINKLYDKDTKNDK